MKSTLTLPPSAILSSSVVTFLNGRFNDQQDLEQASAIVLELQSQCVDLDQSLTAINSRVQSSLLAYASFSDRTHSLITDTTSKLTDLGSLTSASSSFSDTALKLDVLVGDIEDVVAFVMNRNLKRPAPQTSDEMCTHTIEALGKTEDVLTYITKKRSQWTRLVSAVDDRVDRALATLRPQQIADHRMLLTSLGWPPPLSSLTSQILDTEKSSEASNPLFTMHGDLKRKYCENFRALCQLQELQIQRKGRQLEGHNREVALHQPLWAVEELVNPISIACQRHFTKWTDKPEFIFALVYKITRDYVDTMDELLQPLVDEARLVGYSCREEWISAMVTSLSTYLAKEVFTAYISQQEDENVSGILSQARMSWLHLVDLMISFDKRVLSLATHSGVLMSIQEDRNLQKISSLYVFCDKPDWLDFWAEIELSDTLEKLKAEAEDERNWIVKVQGAALLSGPENYRSPLVSSSFLKHLSIVIDRCRSLPTISLRYKFLRSIGAPIVHKFLDCVLLRCQEAEGMTALTDDDGLIKVANSINAVHYFESVVKEWCEMSSLLRWDMTKMILDRMEEGWPVSKNLVESLDYLQAKMAVVEENMNSIDFVSVWRSLASGIDRALFNGVFTSNVKFYDSGVESLGRDMEVVFGVFEAWCIRAEGFFPKMSEGLKLLKKKKKEEKGDEKWMKEKGIRHLGMAEAERILKSRVFGS
ncbi:RINT1-like protein MAG2 [Linum perenne]